MPWISTIGSLLSGLLTGVLTPYFNMKNKQADVTLDGFKSALGSDQAAYQAYVDYLVKVETIRASEMSWWGPKLLFVVVGLPAAIHLGLVYVDSWFTAGLPLVGRFYPLRLPPDYLVIENRLVEMLFGASVVGPPLSAVTAWLHRKG